MAIGAYKQIEELSELAIKNGIDVPRLRGYRLMSEEQPMTKEDYAELDHNVEIESAINFTACFCKGHFYPKEIYRYNAAQRKREHEWIDKEKDCINWDVIHGKTRRAFKLFIKQEKRKAMAQQALFDRYAGQKNILYIHARLGNLNWHPELESQPWFICKIDDAYDCTYCDIYARLNPELS